MVAYVGNIDAPGSTGNVAYTSVGFAPKAVLFWGTTRTSAGANEQTAYSGFFGMTDGATSHVTGMAGAAPTSNTHYMFGDTSCVKMVNSAGTILMEAEIVSLDADGFTLNWTTAGATGADVNFLAIGGANVTDVKVGKATISASGNTNVTGVGFQPDMLILNGFEGASFPLAASDSQNTISIGLDDASNRNCFATNWRNSIIDSGNSYLSSISSIATLTSNNAPVLSGKGTVSAMGADGFTVNMSSHSGIDLHLGYLAIKGGSHYIGDDLAPGSATTQAITGAGFTPEVIFTHNTAVDSNESEGGEGGYEGSAMNIGAADGTRTRFAQWGCDVNGDGGDFQSTTHLIAQAQSIDHVDTMGTLGDEAVLQSLDSDGATLDWTTLTTGLPPLVLFWMFAGGAAVGTYDNKLIYADGLATI